jgi:hypothetical protein
MIFTVLGAVAELERSLIVERVKAGLRNARAILTKFLRRGLGLSRLVTETSRIDNLGQLSFGREPAAYSANRSLCRSRK